MQPLEPLNRPDKRDQIMPGMDQIASDPIGAFQQISNVLMDFRQRLETVETELSVLSRLSTVTSSQN